MEELFAGSAGAFFWLLMHVLWVYGRSWGFVSVQIDLWSFSPIRSRSARALMKKYVRGRESESER